MVPLSFFLSLCKFLISKIDLFYCVLKKVNIKYEYKNKIWREQKIMKKFKTQKGITLIALVITIIVLLILAGITINLTIGQNGIITTAQQAGKNYQQAAEDEQTQLAEFLGETTDKINETASLAQWDGTVNKPALLTGMTAIKFTNPTSTTEGTVVTTNSSDEDWYNYDAKQWANAQTQDGSMWVWIPRFAYKITYYTDANKTEVSTEKTSYGKIEVVFLEGTTDNYYVNGVKKTAGRATSENTSPDTTADYTVHPAFTNESKINYANGGWDSELTGIWVAKFEAGYAGGNNTATVKNSSVAYTASTAWVASADRNNQGDGNDTARNYYNPTGYTLGEKIKYPVFQGLTYSMNYISENDAFNISRVLTESGNIYGLSSTNADSHLMKNSEWGAVAYLSQSQYGLNGENIAINNVTLNSSISTIWAVTGCASTATNASDASGVGTTITSLNAGTTEGVATWTQIAGTKASSTGTIYGIYDLSGGLWEYTASYVANNNANLSYFGNSLITETNRKYVMAYTSADTGITNNNDASTANYNANSVIGDAVKEISTAGTGASSWYGDWSCFAGYGYPFFIRSGSWYYNASAGLFYFSRAGGQSIWNVGFRPVLVAK
jgi:competence protein ComGC